MFSLTVLLRFNIFYMFSLTVFPVQEHGYNFYARVANVIQKFRLPRQILESEEQITWQTLSRSCHPV